MDSCVVLVVLLAFSAHSAGASDDVKYSSELEFLAYHELKTLVAALGDSYTQRPKGDGMLGSFSYSNCQDPSKEVVVVSNLTVTPDPIELPGTLNVSMNALVKGKFGAPLTASLDVYKKIIGLWIKIPCIDNVGSCTYKDICNQLEKIKTCPPILVKQGINCRCPFSPTKVNIKNQSIPLNVKVPSEASGGIKVKIELKSGNTYISCMEVTVELK